MSKNNWPELKKIRKITKFSQSLSRSIEIWKLFSRSARSRKSSLGNRYRPSKVFAYLIQNKTSSWFFRSRVSNNRKKSKKKNQIPTRTLLSKWAKNASFSRLSQEHQQQYTKPSISQHTPSKLKEESSTDSLASWPMSCRKANFCWESKGKCSNSQDELYSYATKRCPPWK